MAHSKRGRRPKRTVTQRASRSKSRASRGLSERVAQNRGQRRKPASQTRRVSSSRRSGARKRVR